MGCGRPAWGHGFSTGTGVSDAVCNFEDNFRALVEVEGTSRCQSEILNSETDVVQIFFFAEPETSNCESFGGVEVYRSKLRQ